MGQHRDEAVDVTAMPRFDVPAREMPEPIIAKAPECGLLTQTGEPSAQGLVRTLERAVHRRGRGREHLGNLAAGKPEDIVEDERGALAGRKVLEGSDEGQLHALTLAVTGLWRARSVGDGVLHRRVRADPHRVSWW